MGWEGSVLERKAAYKIVQGTERNSSNVGMAGRKN
jgi:hypothetical protein